jgi:anti-anti-sigma factor
MSELQNASELEVVDRGPGWLFVRIHPDQQGIEGLADRLWQLMNQQFIHRVVLEMHDVDFLPSLLMGQLVMLHKRILQRDGALRLCGLSPACLEMLQLCRLDQALPHFDCREDAIRGFVTPKPR